MSREKKQKKIPLPFYQLIMGVTQRFFFSLISFYRTKTDLFLRTKKILSVSHSVLLVLLEVIFFLFFVFDKKKRKNKQELIL